MARSEFDVCVVGAGSAGLSVAAGTSQLGLKTVLIERGEMGGECLNSGCVPSKAMLAAAKAAHGFGASQIPGVGGSTPTLDFAAVKDGVREVIETIAPHDSVARFEKLGVTVLRDTARFVDAETMEVGDARIRARWFVIATGSQAVVPGDSRTGSFPDPDQRHDLRLARQAGSPRHHRRRADRGRNGGGASPAWG